MYFLIGGTVWLCTLKSGIHPTIAGVALGLLTPSKAGLTDAAFLERFERASNALRTHSERTPNALRTQPVDQVSRRHVLSDLAFAARDAMSRLVRLESNLHPWVAFLIMPLFALANAGIPINSSALDEPIAVAAGVGLFAANHQSLSERCAYERPEPQAHRLVVDPIHPEAQLTKQREMKIGILSRDPRLYSSHRPEVLLGRSAWGPRWTRAQVSR